MRKKVVRADDDDQDDAPINGPLRDRVAGMRIVMYGGSPREEARENLERRPGIGTLEWPESDKQGRIDAIVESVEAGTIDVLLVLGGLVNHKESVPLIAAPRRSGTPYAVVETGYGIGAVRGAMEVALGSGTA